MSADDVQPGSDDTSAAGDTPFAAEGAPAMADEAPKWWQPSKKADRTEFLPIPGELRPNVLRPEEPKPEAPSPDSADVAVDDSVADIEPEHPAPKHSMVHTPRPAPSGHGLNRWVESATPPHTAEKKVSSHLLRHIVSWSVHHRSVVILLSILVVLGGLIGGASLKRELLPPIDFPIIVVSTPVPGSDPQNVADDVTAPIESALSGLKAVKRHSSTSVDGFSTVVIEYDLDIDAKEAQETLERALSVVRLPDGALAPKVTRVDSATQVAYRLAIDANGISEESLSRAVRDTVVPMLKDGRGVADVRMRGGVQKRVDIRLDPDKMKKYRISVEQIDAAIRSADLSLPAGSIQRGDKIFSVRIGTSLGGIEALKDLVIGSTGGAGGPPAGFAGAAGSAASVPQVAPVTTTTSTTLPAASPDASATGDAGATRDAAATKDASATADASVSKDAAALIAKPVVTPAPKPKRLPKPRSIVLHEVATVAIAETRPAGISRTDGEDGLTLEIFREGGASSAELSQSVEDAIPAIDKMLGEAEITKVFDEADVIDASIDGLLEEAAIGAALVVLIVFAFLRSGRATLVTVLSIPVSVLVALIFARIFDLSFNIMTLSGLTIAIGRVIDDAIVVLENIYSRIQRGEDPGSASVNGTAEVASAIGSSTLAAVAVFLPIGLVGGIISKFFLSFSLIITCALLASLIVSITLVPVLANLTIKRVHPRKASDEGLDPDAPPKQPWLQLIYTPILRFSLKHRAVTIGLALVLFVASIFVAQRIPVTFLPSTGLDSFNGTVTLASGTDLEDSGLRLQPFEEILDEDLGVARYAIDVGGSDPFSAQGSNLSENQASVYVRVKKSSDADEVKERLEAKGRKLFGDDFTLAQSQGGPPSGVLEVVLTNSDAQQLKAASDKAVSALSELKGVQNIKSDLSVAKDEFSVVVDAKKAAAKGVSAAPVAFTLRSLINGSDVGELKVDGTKLSLFLAVDEERADSPEDLGKLPVMPVSGVELEDIADVTQLKGPVAVTRTDGVPSVRVSGAITAQDTSGVSSKAEEILDELNMPPGTRFQLGGDQESQQDSFRDMGIAMVIAVVIVYLILVLFFGSLLHPFTVILSLPLASIGAFGGLLIGGQALGLPALLGILMLIGIVVANAILLVDFIQKARAQGVSKYQSQILAGRRRVRPILMTATVTIGALIPLALGLSGGGSQLVTGSLAVVVIGGLASSTLLTLAVIPAVYSLLDSARAWAFAEAPEEDDGFMGGYGGDDEYGEGGEGYAGGFSGNGGVGHTSASGHHHGGVGFFGEAVDLTPTSPAASAGFTGGRHFEGESVSDTGMPGSEMGESAQVIGDPPRGAAEEETWEPQDAKWSADPEWREEDDAPKP